MKFISYLIFIVLFSVYSYGINYECDKQCIVKVDPKTKKPTGDLNCTLPNMPDVSIIAQDVLISKSNKLKTYFGRTDNVCTILDYMNEGAGDFSKITGFWQKAYDTLALEIKHKDGKGQVYFYNGIITIDSDSKEKNNLNKNDSNYSDGNLILPIINYATVHELFHFIQDGIFYNGYGDDFWIREGTARMFEDIVYDIENPYLSKVYKSTLFYNKGEKLVNILQNMLSLRGNDTYTSFAFWKLMQTKCKFDMRAIFPDPLNNFHTSIYNCTAIPNIEEDKVAGAFVLYNWAMILYNDMSLFEEDEPINFLINTKVKELDKANFQTTVDMRSMLHSLPPFNDLILPPFSAQSFLITKETLKSCNDISITLKGDNVKLTAIRVNGDGSSKVDDNFVMSSKNTLETRPLDAKDKSGALFVTVTNTTDKAVAIDSLTLNKVEDLDTYKDMFTQGALMVDMSWQNSDIAMELEVGGLQGIMESSDESCKPMQHFVVESEESIKPGTYPVNVRHSAVVDESLMPQNITIVIDLPKHKNAAIFDLNLSHSNMLNIGHVADIIISQDNKIEFVESVKLKNKVDSGYITQIYSESSEHKYETYQYDVVSRLKQALLGPLSNAIIEIHEATNLLLGMPIYTSATTGGESLLTSGAIHFSDGLAPLIDDEKLYIISIKGGMDIDADDNGVLDINPTENLGTIRAVVTGKQLKYENFKINLLTEVIYQLSKTLYENKIDTEIVLTKLNCLAKKILKDDSDYNDILQWMPQFDKSKLQKSYRNYYIPILNKIHKNKDIEEDAYKLISSSMSISENAKSGDVVGKIDNQCDKNATYRLEGTGSQYFIIDENNTIRLALNMNLDYETYRKFTLSVISSNAITDIDKFAITIGILNIFEQAPFLKAFQGEVEENATIGTIIGKVENDIGRDSAVITSYSLDDNSVFSIDNNGTVRLNAIVDYEIQTSYELNVTASNEIGISEPKRVLIDIIDRGTAPTLESNTFILEDDREIGTRIGDISLLNDGDSPILNMKITGEGASNFIITKATP